MPDRPEFSKRFKAAVARNFDQSAAVYDAFEDRHHLFETLTRRLCELIAPEAPARVLDVGCGTGISTLALQKHLPYSPVIYAIDISESMLVQARERCKGIPGLYFVRGDAERLSEYFNEAFDGVFYTASIFLLPNFRESIEQACRLIVPGGVLAISFYAGLFDRNDRDALARAFPGMKYQYGAVSYHELLDCLKGKREFRTTEVDYRFEVAREFLFDFLSIPAQSAGLFPKVPYIERIPMVRGLCEELTEKVSPVFMGWKFVISRRG
ncbi:MAG: class I SAM-dependent methyltransferase [Gemmatimonadota bacterium]